MLHFEKMGSGFPLIICHGLFGAGNNWRAIAKALQENFEVYLVDMPNHGQSPHFNKCDYPFMASVLNEFLTFQMIEKCHILGHSMGGKIAMQALADHPEKFEKAIIADIAPKSYQAHHDDILAGIQAVASEVLTSRNDAEGFLQKHIDSGPIIQWLLKSVIEKEVGHWGWTFNAQALSDNYNDILKSPEINNINHHALFVRGELSNYVLEDDYETILKMIPHATFETMSGVGHWLHAERPSEFLQKVKGFL